MPEKEKVTFCIYQPKPPKPEEKKVCLSLVQNGDAVIVVAVDEKGVRYEAGSLFEITSTGMIYSPALQNLSGVTSTLRLLFSLSLSLKLEIYLSS